MEEYELLIRIASNNAGLILWGDTLKAMQHLPSSAQPLSEVLRLRMTVCADLGQWKEGQGIAAFLATAAAMPSVMREAVGRFHLRDAIAHADSYDQKEARVAFGRMCMIWPAGRKESLDIDALEWVWH